MSLNKFTLHGELTNELTDSTGGTASTTTVANLADGTTYATDHAAIENNFATLTAKLNAVIAALNTANT